MLTSAKGRRTATIEKSPQGKKYQEAVLDSTQRARTNTFRKSPSLPVAALKAFLPEELFGEGYANRRKKRIPPLFLKHASTRAPFVCVLCCVLRSQTSKAQPLDTPCRETNIWNQGERRNSANGLVPCQWQVLNSSLSISPSLLFMTRVTKEKREHERNTREERNTEEGAQI